MDKFQQKSLPIGLSDFKSLIEKCYFVDKSKFIAEILEHEGTQVTLITRPRRFGKTLILSMLNYFFNLDDAEKNKHLFQGLSIEKSHHFKRQGTSPIIFLSFKDIVGNNILDLSQTLSTHISILYKKYIYLLDSLNINKFDKEYFETICKQQGSLSQVKIALKELTRFLSTHHQKNTLVLIDEYDAPIINAWKNKYYDAAIELMRNVYSSVLKDNIYLDMAVITGVAIIAKESIFSGLNNLEICSVFNDEYSDIFGFEEPEIKNMMNYYGLIEKFAKVKEWYDGYIFGKSEIYNPLSILEYLKHQGEPQAYWVNTSGNIIIKYLVQHSDLNTKKELTNLLQRGQIQKFIEENLVYADLAKDLNALYGVMVASGYLKIKEKSYVNHKWLCSLQIPNLEIYQIFQAEILKNIDASLELNLFNLMQSMLAGDAVTFSTLLQDYILKCASFYDTTKLKGENFYHGLILGLLASISKEYLIQSNGESGHGRFDIICIPKNKDHWGVILEFKAAKAKKSLTQEAKAALKQIEVKAYTSIFALHEVKKFWQYGIAFYKKNVFMLRRSEP